MIHPNHYCSTYEKENGDLVKKKNRKILFVERGCAENFKSIRPQNEFCNHITELINKRTFNQIKGNILSPGRATKAVCNLH